MEPVIIPREEHTLSRDDICPYALKVLYRLRASGYLSYLVGGCVRDLLIGRKPKDFDLATNATPNQLKKVFRNCRLIGRRFRLAHIHFGRDIIEVATFRANNCSQTSRGTIKSDAGVLVRDNIWGTPKEDALRRDFTVNALYYNIDDFSVIDYAQALPDLNARLLRSIGNPDERYLEDPVRMLRAVRFATTLDFDVEAETYDAICRQHAHIAEASNARLYEDVLKVLRSGATGPAVDMMLETGLLRILFPDWARWLEEESTDEEYQRMCGDHDQLDQLVADGKKLSPAILYTFLFATYHYYLIERVSGGSLRPAPEDIHTAIAQHMSTLSTRVLIPQRQVARMSKILENQPRFAKTSESKAKRFKGSEAFDDSFMYYKYMCGVTGEGQDLIEFWETLEAPRRAKRTRRRDRAPESGAHSKRGNGRRGSSRGTAPGAGNAAPAAQ